MHIMTTIMTTRKRLVLLAFALLIGLISLVTGCREQRAVAPNEKTAAPARLPGEDPHAGTPTTAEHIRK
jgi:hypothetical protein